MKQSTVWTLLSRLTEQLVLYYSEDGKISDTKEFSERLALSTWEGLILLLRQSIANSDEVLLEEVGYFRKIEDDWIFKPAASLLEVDAMKLEATDSHMYLAQKAIFYLQVGEDLLSNIAADQEIPAQAEAETPEEKLLVAIFGDAAVKDSMLSDRMEHIGNRLVRTARRLRGESVDTRHLSEHQAEYYSSARDRTTQLYTEAQEKLRQAGRPYNQEEKRRAEIEAQAEAEASAES